MNFLWLFGSIYTRNQKLKICFLVWWQIGRRKMALPLASLLSDEPLHFQRPKYLFVLNQYLSKWHLDKSYLEYLLKQWINMEYVKIGDLQVRLKINKFTWEKLCRRRGHVEGHDHQNPRNRWVKTMERVVRVRTQEDYYFNQTLNMKYTDGNKRTIIARTRAHARTRMWWPPSLGYMYTILGLLQRIHDLARE